MDTGYEIIAAVPPVEDYLRLRVSAGLSAKSLEGAVAGLPNTLFAVIVKQDDQIIGMGRVIGDGGLFYQVVDIAVEPDHQGRGLGKAIVRAIVDQLKSTAPVGAYISLIADGDAQYLYAQFGFKPTAPASIGMAFTIR